MNDGKQEMRRDLRLTVLTVERATQRYRKVVASGLELKTTKLKIFGHRLNCIIKIQPSDSSGIVERGKMERVFG